MLLPARETRGFPFRTQNHPSTWPLQPHRPQPPTKKHKITLHSTKTQNPKTQKPTKNPKTPKHTTPTNQKHKNFLGAPPLNPAESLPRQTGRQSKSQKRAYPDLNQGPADLQSAALTTELYTHVQQQRATMQRLHRAAAHHRAASRDEPLCFSLLVAFHCLIPPRHKRTAHAGSRTRVTSMGGLYDAATLRALLMWRLPVWTQGCTRVAPSFLNACWEDLVGTVTWLLGLVA